MNKNPLLKDSTIYHYQLIKRVHFRRLYLPAGLIPLPVFLAAETILYGWNEWPWLIVSYLFVQALHTVLCLLLLKFRDEAGKTQWHFRLSLPWNGYAPKKYISFSFLWQTQIHLLVIGLAVIGCFVPWVPSLFAVNLLFIHLWILIPRLGLMFLLRSKERDVVVKLNDADISLYMP
jgi:hypothetical protein